ncbi:protocadherin beta-15-like [Cyrtonyx montezumae]|uniref:protocadherin beta-15-like n=1 Tax=Cyrtonyx montezumae TaxID=9017 RepID=UPI0032DB2216
MAAARQVLCLWALLGVSRVRCEPIRYSVAEESESGSVVADVAEDAGLAPAQLSARRARIVSPAGRHHFRLERSTGRLVLAERLDREQMCGSLPTCTLTFELLLVDPLQIVPVEVSVEDINDHSPVFPDERVTFNIPERGDQGSRFPVRAAQDLDIGINDIQAYSIHPEIEFFTVSFQTQSVNDMHVDLILQKSLDREEQPELDFTLLAIDGGTPPRSGSTQIHILVLDVNDNAPTFTQKLYLGQILENAPEGSVVLRVVANDADVGINGDITYDFSQAGIHKYSDFAVDPKSGEIRVMKSLDFETTQKYEFSVRAVDGGGLSSMCKVVVEVVDVNDNAPEVVVSSFSSPLPENAGPGTVVAIFAIRDQDSGVNGEISCALEDQLTFTLRSAFKNYYELVTVSTLDREERAQHIVVVTAADAGSPPLTTTHTFTVEISDINDNAPIFNQTSYTMFVHENNVPSMLIGAVNATDADTGPNAKVSYSLLPAYPAEQVPCSCVSVNSENGHVFVLRPLDYEKLKQLEVVVSAADAGSPALSSNITVRLVVVDENDNAPLVLHPAQDSSPPSSELVPAWAEVGDLVSKVVAVDADSGQNSWLSYELLKATEPGLFAVGAQSGEVRLRRPLTDRDAVKQKLIVLVRDNGQPPLSATAVLSVLLLNGLWDAQLPQQSPAAEHEDSSLTTYLIVSLVFVSLLFLVSAVAFVVCKLCKRKDLSSGHVLYDASNMQSYVADGATAGTVPHTYCYELSLTTGSGNSEFKFMKPVLPSLPAQPVLGYSDTEEFPPLPLTMGDEALDSHGT